MLIPLIVLGLASGYLVHALLLEEKYSHEGPVKLPKRFVVFPETGHVQRASLFDAIRRIFGVYKVSTWGDGNFYWEVQKDPSERWTCPFCLSFWASLPATAVFYTITPDPLWVIPAHFAISSIATVVYGMIEGALQ